MEANMLKRIMVVAAVSSVALTGALAQTPTSPSSSAAPSATPSTSTPSAAGKADFIPKQSPDQHLASKFTGTNVIGTDDKKIGDVSDVLFDKDNKIIAFVVGVGGFLGIGQKDVAIAPVSFEAVSGTNGNAMKLRLSMTKDELKAAPTFERYQPPRPVSSQNLPVRPMGAPSPLPKSSTQ
jgi:sporulation protein YlmC with PRC-barrel domain